MSSASRRIEGVTTVDFTILKTAPDDPASSHTPSFVISVPECIFRAGSTFVRQMLLLMGAKPTWASCLFSQEIVSEAACYIAARSHGHFQCASQSVELPCGGARHHSLYSPPSRYLLALHHSLSWTPGRGNLPGGGGAAGPRSSAPVVQGFSATPAHPRVGSRRSRQSIGGQLRRVSRPVHGGRQLRQGPRVLRQGDFLAHGFP